jgi:hypothetical protein
LAYGLFTIAVQLKVYPLIFIVMLIRDWHDWKNNIKRFLMLIGINFALLLVMGFGVFIDFTNAIKAQTINPYIWIGNHSTRSFVTRALDKLSQSGLVWLNGYSGGIQLALLALIVLSILLILMQAYRQNQNGISPYLLIACALGALLIPSVSHDYTLTILAAPIAILFSELTYTSKMAFRSPKQLIFIGLILILSAAYASTLFSYTNKPFFAQNNFPALLTMLLAIVCLSVISSPVHPEKPPDPAALIGIGGENL